MTDSTETAILTTCQQAAFERFKDFMEDKSSKVFVLHGYAGTGKTFLIGYFARWLQERRKHRVQILAPTGRAAQVITEKTGIPGSTIHRCIYNLDRLKEYDERRAQFKFFFQNRRPSSQETNTVYIVDESSMVSDVRAKEEFIQFGSGRVLKDLLEFVGVGEDDWDAKVIFVGDPAQLPPVNMNKSPALNPQYIKSKYGIEVKVCSLTEVVRQARHSAILEAATRIRCNIERLQFNELMIEPCKDEIEAVAADRVADLWAGVYQPGNPEVPPPFVCITYTNDAALSYNLMIRAKLFGGSGEQEVRAGDYLIVVANNRLYGLSNGDLAVVLKVDEQPEHRRIKFLAEDGEKQVNLRFRHVEIAFRHSNEGYTKMRCLILENTLFNNMRDITREEQKALYIDCKNRYKCSSISTFTFANMLLNDPYFNALRVKFGYAITCHKAQGGEWPSAAVVFENQRTDLTGLRWAYTAITRAKEKLFGVNLPKKVPWSCINVIHRNAYEVRNNSHITCVAPDIKRYVINDVAFINEFPSEHVFLIQKHCAAVEKWAAEGIKVEEVEVMPKKFFVRYKLSRGKSFAKLHMTFSLKAKFTVQILPESSADIALAQQARDILQAVPHTSYAYNNNIDVSFPESNPVLKRFYDEVVLPRSEKAGITIIGVQHLCYRERYTFQVGGEQTTIDFLFNKRGEFTKYEAMDDEVSIAVVKRILGDLCE